MSSFFVEKFWVESGTGVRRTCEQGERLFPQAVYAHIRGLGCEKVLCRLPHFL